MSTTTFQLSNPTVGVDERKVRQCPEELLARYREVLDVQRMSWTEHLRLTRLLGKGGQGVVYLSERRGTDAFTLPVALKIFSPEPFVDARSYDLAMGRIARVAARVAQIQQDNLLDVHNFLDRNRIRIMEMEWVDGYDLSQLATREMYERARGRVSQRRWDYLNDVIVTTGQVQPRLKPGIAMAITRECLAALAALHREAIVHGDIKPSNIMLKRTGNAKIVDIGSAFEITDPPPSRTVTPQYAAPEVLDGQECTPRSDLASLGYVLIEMLSGRQPFSQINDYHELLEAKRFLPQRLSTFLPEEVLRSDLLINFVRGLISPDPTRRFPSAEAADFAKEGAASFNRQLIKGDLASEFQNEIRGWLEDLD